MDSGVQRSSLTAASRETHLPLPRLESPGHEMTLISVATRHLDRGRDASACSDESVTWRGSSGPLGIILAPPPRSCAVGGKVEGDESDKDAGRLLSCCGDWRGRGGENNITMMSLKSKL